MKTEEFDLALIGATFLAVGAAAACPGRCVIIEEKASPGYEFVDAFRFGPLSAEAPATETGKAFRRRFEDAGLLARPFVPGWAAPLCAFAAERGLDLLLHTCLLGAERADGGVRLTVYNSEGRRTLFARRVVDTRTGAFCEKTLNAVLCGGRPAAFDAGMTVYPVDEDCAIAAFRVPDGADLPAARKLVFDLWAHRPEALLKTRIAAVADFFALKAAAPERTVFEGYREIPSAYYDDPFSAFDRGCAIGGEACD